MPGVPYVPPVAADWSASRLALSRSEVSAWSSYPLVAGSLASRVASRGLRSSPVFLPSRRRGVPLPVGRCLVTFAVFTLPPPAWSTRVSRSCLVGCTCFWSPSCARLGPAFAFVPALLFAPLVLAGCDPLCAAVAPLGLGSLRASRRLPAGLRPECPVRLATSLHPPRSLPSPTSGRDGTLERSAKVCVCVSAAISA